MLSSDAKHMHRDATDRKTYSKVYWQSSATKLLMGPGPVMVYVVISEPDKASKLMFIECEYYEHWDMHHCEASNMADDRASHSLHNCFKRKTSCAP